MSFSYSVSLQVWHPDADPQSIVAGIGLPPSRCWAAGDQRMTPKGTRLDGKYRESYCVFRLGGSDDGELANFLAATLQKLESQAAFINHLRGSGGKVSFFVSWTPGGRGEVFDVQLLADMARLGINLGIEPLT